MKRILFLAIVFVVAALTFVGCNSVETIVDKPEQMSHDVELLSLYNSVDSLQREYSALSQTRVDWDKWGRRGLNLVVDGFVSFALVGTGPICSLLAGGAASGLYEDYIDHMVAKSDEMVQPFRRIPEAVPSMQSVVFTADNATFVDSIGYYHNLILDNIKAKGRSYTSDSGIINYNAYMQDVIAVAKDCGIEDDFCIDTKLLFNYLESIIKPLADLECDECAEINEDKIVSILFNDAYEGLNNGSLSDIEQRKICEKFIYNCINISDDCLVDYGTAVNELIVNSKVKSDVKTCLKVANNIAVNSSLRK